MNDYYHSSHSKVGEHQQDLDQQNTQSEFTEVFSWGSDRFGQLGLGKQVNSQKQYHMVPRFCSYNIPITQVACGSYHSVFITSSQLIYSMGSNAKGQLGIDDPYTQQKSSPVLIEALVAHKPVQIACGRNGDVFSWGNNENGQCGTGSEPFHNVVHWTPKPVKFEDYSKPSIKFIDCGEDHSGFIDDIGRLFMCGRGNKGQLGNMSYQDELQPFYISKIPDKVLELACGDEHTLVLTRQGEIYSMGSNSRGQLGTGGSHTKDQNVPILLQELSFMRMAKVRAGPFSASLSIDNQLYIWGSGSFGEFFTPHRVKSVQSLDIADFQIGRSGFLAVLTRQGQIYTWGSNEMGQLGQRDCIQRSTPHKVDALEGKRATQIQCGTDYVIALGLTLPQSEAKKKQDLRSSQRRKESSSRGRQMNTIPKADYDTVNSHSANSIKKKSKIQSEVKSSQRQSVAPKSANKHQSMNISSINYNRHPADQDQNQHYTPLRNSPTRKSYSSSNKSQKPHISKTSKPAFQEEYKPPSQLHEQVVNSLRREKDSLQLALNSEISNRRVVESENEQLRRQILEQEKELREIKNNKNNLEQDLKNNAQRSHSEYEAMKDANYRLQKENEDVKQRAYEQENLLNSLNKELEDQSSMIDYMRKEIDNCKVELSKQDELRKDLRLNQELRAKSESALKDLAEEIENYKEQIEGRNAQDIASLQKQIKDLKYQNEEYYHQLQKKQEENSYMSQDMLQWRDLVERLNSESTELKKIIEDLEMKNRKLVERLNDQIYQKASEYKERTLQALTKSESPTKLRRALAGGQQPQLNFSDQRLAQVIQDENNPPPHHQHSSPLKQLPQEMTMDPGNRGVSKYNVVKELDRLETQQHMQNNNDSNASFLDQSKTFSPLRQIPASQSNIQRQEISPYTKEELIDINYKRVRESCERIASALGIDTSQVLMNASKSPSGNQNNQSMFSPNMREVTTQATNFFNPNQVQSPIQPSTSFQMSQHNNNMNSEQQQPSASQVASSMVRQSLHELRQKLDQMRREKDAVENSLSAYEERRQLH